MAVFLSGFFTVFTFLINTETILHATLLSLFSSICVLKKHIHLKNLSQRITVSYSGLVHNAKVKGDKGQGNFKRHLCLNVVGPYTSAD